MDNISCTIIELDNNKNENENENENENKNEKFLNVNDLVADNYNDEQLALEYYYSTNFNIKKLSKILDFYNLPTKKLKKQQLIDAIIIFELNVENSIIVAERKRLWQNFNELKNNSFFNKYILDDL